MSARCHLAIPEQSSQARSQTFYFFGQGEKGGGGGIGQIFGSFMITRGLSCDRIGFGHLGEGQGGR